MTPRNDHPVALDPLEFALHEFGRAGLGDVRRSSRAVLLAAALAANPRSTLTDACGDSAATKGAYRLLDNPDVDPASLLAAHRERTMERCRSHALVLAVEDTTFLDFATHEATTGLGHATDEKERGLFVHSAFAVSEEGEPLGVLAQHAWARPPPAKGKQPPKPRADKESARWETTFEEAVRGFPSEVARVVAVADREADDFDFMERVVALGRDFLVRAAQDRRVANEQAAYLRDALNKAPLSGVADVSVGRSAERLPRVARVEIRHAQVDLRAPRYRAGWGRSPLRVHAILVKESRPPPGEKRVEWVLLTTLPVGDVQDCHRVIRFYALRWLIERLHYGLKSGCRIEDVQLERADRILRLVPILSAVAWRILHLTHVARLRPNEPALRHFTPTEIAALRVLLARRKGPRLPEGDLTLRDAVRGVARLGGFLARKGDGEPGMLVIWRGLRRLEVGSQMMAAMTQGG